MLNRFEKLVELETKATKGPWVNDYWTGQCHQNHHHGRGKCEYEYTLASNDISHQYISRDDPKNPHAVVITTDEYGALYKDDGQLITEMRNMLPDLIEVVRAAKAICLDEGYDTGLDELETLRSALSKLQD